MNYPCFEFVIKTLVSIPYRRSIYFGSSALAAVEEVFLASHSLWFLANKFISWIGRPTEILHRDKLRVAKTRRQQAGRLQHVNRDTTWTKWVTQKTALRSSSSGVRNATLSLRSVADFLHFFPRLPRPVMTRTRAHHHQRHQFSPSFPPSLPCAYACTHAGTTQ